ncbi:MAG: uroporphyrinogen decarboxylase family protein [Candidatus Hydrogenedentota bacterium]
MTSTADSLFTRALHGQRTARPPVWFMRQAGRTDPEYNRLKAESGMRLDSLFRHPEMAARISLLPRRLGVDAIIMFQDILTPLTPMGAPFRFAPGPVLDKPPRSAAELAALHTYDVMEELPFIPRAIELLREELEGALPVLGFAGAPFTLAAFLAEGKSFKAEAPALRALMEENPQALHRLLDKLTTLTTHYLELQRQAGVAALQLFESAALLLNRREYWEFALPYQRRILDAFSGRVPTIIFARDWPYLADYAEAGADVVSLPSSIDLGEARAALGHGCVLQGNLDNQLVAEGPPARIRQAVRECVAAGEREGHIVNLNHGLLRDTPFEHIQTVVEEVHAAAAGME